MISVVIPSYNHGNALPACLDSIRAQSYQDIEVVVVDDGSTDGTENIVSDYIKRHPGEFDIGYIKTQNRGAPAARNMGEKKTRGEYILFADADITMAPMMLEKLLIVLNKNPQASYAYSSFKFGSKLFVGESFDADKLKKMNYIHTSALIRREHFPGFDESLKRFQDWDLWLTMLKQGHTGIFTSETLFEARVTRAGISKWRPSFWYKLWPIFGYAPTSYRAYMKAREIILKKHHIIDENLV